MRTKKLRGPHRQRIAARLKALRQSYGMTTAQLGSSLGRTQGYASGLENGRYSFDVELLYRITEAFGVHVTELLSEDSTDVGGLVADAWADSEYRRVATLLAQAYLSDDPMFDACARVLSRKTTK